MVSEPLFLGISLQNHHGEGTQSKGQLEEQLQRQESKLQEFIENSLLKRRQTNEKLEILSSEFKTFMTTITNQIGKLSRSINGEKGVPGSEGEGAEKTPTPTRSQSLEIIESNQERANQFP